MALPTTIPEADAILQSENTEFGKIEQAVSNSIRNRESITRFWIVDFTVAHALKEGMGDPQDGELTVVDPQASGITFTGTFRIANVSVTYPSNGAARIIQRLERSTNFRIPGTFGGWSLG